MSLLKSELEDKRVNPFRGPRDTIMHSSFPSSTLPVSLQHSSCCAAAKRETRPYENEMPPRCLSHWRSIRKNERICM